MDNSTHIIQQVLVYIAIFLVLALMVYGTREVYVGYKLKQNWAKITAIVLIVISLLAIIGGIVFYFYAMALGKAFNH